jgi:ABC-2 type transport system ATP-binding protein
VFAIQALGLSKSFDGSVAVDGIELVVESGDIVALLGPNGAGKTTTLMMLLGITQPDAGEIQLLGHRLPEGRLEALARMNFTASYISFPDRIRVREALDVFADLYVADRDRIPYVVDLFGIEPLLSRPISHLSSGQRTLVGLAKSLLNRPELLILDEPTASLDPEVAERIRRTLMRVHEEDGCTMLITSHNMRDVERLCRRVIFVAKGRVVADGSPSEIASRYGHDDLEDTFLSIAREARE